MRTLIADDDLPEWEEMQRVYRKNYRASMAKLWRVLRGRSMTQETIDGFLAAAYGPQERPESP